MSTLFALFDRRNFIQRVRNTTAALATVAISSPVLSFTANACTEDHVTHTIEIDGLEFKPDRLTVAPGDCIMWVNKDFVPHTATADDGRWTTETLKTDDMEAIVFTKDMMRTHTYFCTFHPGMRASITVAG